MRYLCIKLILLAILAGQFGLHICQTLKWYWCVACLGKGHHLEPLTHPFIAGQHFIRTDQFIGLRRCRALQ